MALSGLITRDSKFDLGSTNDTRLAPMVEQWAFNPRVVGSNQHRVMGS